MKKTSSTLPRLIPLLLITSLTACDGFWGINDSDDTDPNPPGNNGNSNSGDKGEVDNIVDPGDNGGTDGSGDGDGSDGAGETGGTGETGGSDGSDGSGETGGGTGETGGGGSVTEPTTGLDPNMPPSGNFDLTVWKLTLPVSKDEYFGTGGTNAAEILPLEAPSSDLKTLPPLDEGYEDPNFFYTATDGTMLFKTPLYGGTSTVNSSYVRTELRELYNWDPSKSSGDANWDNEGSHVLSAKLEVVSYWPDDPQTVVGQIHAKDSSKALVKLQWDGPTKKVRAIINEDPSKGNPFSLDFGVVGQGKFTYTISLINKDLTITVNDITHSLTFGEGNMSADWDKHVYYFKAGNYAQADKAGGGMFEVAFSELNVRHSN